MQTWGSNEPVSEHALWTGPNSIGHFRYNSSHLIDFVIVDTNLTPRDSFGSGLFPNAEFTEILRGPQKLYFASRQGILSIDSLTHSASWLSKASSSWSQISADGSLIVCDSATSVYDFQLHVINTRTGAQRALDQKSFLSFLSPHGDHLAVIGADPNTPFRVTVESVSPP